jgi:hypothetical protein
MRVVSCLTVLAVIASFTACLDMPITRISKTEDPVGRGDAGEDGDFDPQAACRACVAAPDEPGPGCEKVLSACQADPICNFLINCAFESVCFQGSRKAFLTCATPCLTKAGVMTGNEKVIEIASTLFTCAANGPCGDVCFSSE